MPRICDYEGSHYRHEFWEGHGRDYEDLAERYALRAMLPPEGNILLDIGAGFGRLVDLYQGYQTVILLDYARSQLEEAQAFLNLPPNDKRILFVVGDIYQLPFTDNLIDSLVMVRVMHHLAAVPAALQEMQRVLTPHGVAITEFASKHHLKAIARWFLRRQAWSPFAESPLEFVEMNFDFHPAWMRRQFETAGLAVEQVRTTSHYRHPLFKRIFSPRFLAALDSLAQPSGRYWQLTPSVFFRAGASKPSLDPAGFFRCPACHSLSFETMPECLYCLQCHRKWSTTAGIFDFKIPID
jgi:ubiquinone/menaquinone biosynthesis C-methylase UbiE